MKLDIYKFELFCNIVLLSDTDKQEENVMLFWFSNDPTEYF